MENGTVKRRVEVLNKSSICVLLAVCCPVEEDLVVHPSQGDRVTNLLQLPS